MNEKHQTLLLAAAGAIEAGNHESAERMLRQILNEEPYTAEAWYLLSLTLDEWRDQTACLKNALVADPELHEASERLESLEEQGLTTVMWGSKLTVPLLEEVRREGLEDYFVASRLEEYGVDPLDDPLQCPYCGVVNPVENKVCTNCKRVIVFPEPKSGDPTPNLKTAVLLAGLAVSLGLFEIATGALWQWYSTSDVPWVRLGVGGALEGAAGRFLFGGLPPEDLLSRTAIGVIIVGIVRLALLVITWLGAYNRWGWGYYAAAAVSTADVLLQAVLAAYRLAGPAVAVSAAILSATAAIMLFTAKVDFAIIKVRAAVAPDPRAKSAGAFYRRGMRAKQAGMWALAVANWRRAVGAAPFETEYYRWLGLGYIQLKRYDRALPVLEEGRRQNPTNPEFDELLALIRDIMAKKGSEARDDLIAPLWETES